MTAIKIFLSIVLLSTVFSTSLFAQNNYSVKGAVADTDLRIKLRDAAINVLNAKDSTLQTFTHVAEDGTFAVSGLPAGKYILLAIYPDYADYVETFTLDDAHAKHDFGSINMRLKEKILREVLIKGEVQAIKLKGDTTEFNAKAYVIQPNDKVEDLIKQLPGMQVDKDGKITANGVAVTKVLLDGEEFFGDDPTLVTKNIRADMVEKLQLFDKKSDQAAFTGIDDGVKTKTINVVLKEDKKKGTFGKVTAGAGDKQYYEGQALYNKFTAKTKYALYGTLANDGKAGLGYADQDKIGASTTTSQIIGGVTYNTSNSDADFQSSYNGNGSPLARTAGAHFDGKWAGDNQSINTNYKIGSLEITGYQSIISQQNLPGNAVLNSNQYRTFDNYTFKQKLDAAYNIKIDTSTNLKVTADGALRNSHYKSNSLTTVTDGGSNLINQVQESLDNTNAEKIYHVNALYTKKLKHGRTFSWNVYGAYDQTVTNGYQVSTANYYKAGGIDSTSLVNQYKPVTNTSSTLNSNMTFSQVLSKKWGILFNYGLSVNNSIADRKSFNQSSPGNYNVLVDSLSSDYKFTQITNQFGAVFNYTDKKAILSFGTQAADANFKQTDQSSGALVKRDFVNWLPQANLQYRFNQSNTLILGYNGNTSQPTIDQLQPVASNTNPTNIIIGNPGLRPSFSNRFQLILFSSRILNQQSLVVSGNAGFTTDAIISSVVTNAAGKSTTQSVNLIGYTPFNYSMGGGYTRKIPFIDANVGFNFNSSENIGYSYVNNQLDRSATSNFSGTLNFSKSKVKKYSFSVQAGPGYQFSKFSLQPLTNNDAPTFRTNADGTIYLPAKLQLSSDISYNYQGKTQSEAALARNLWNASISKTFLKDDNLKFSLAANNILNQNPTINRNVTANMISQSFYSSVTRFFMLSVTWDFTKFGTIAEKK